MKIIAKAALAISAFALAAPSFAEVVVVVNAKSAISSMTEDQVAQVFLGKNSSLSPVDQSDSNGIRGEFYKKVTGKDASQVKAVWSKLVFTGKATLPKEMASSAEVKKAIAADANGIGYIEKSALDGSVKSILTVQ